MLQGAIGAVTGAAHAQRVHQLARQYICGYTATSRSVQVITLCFIPITQQPCNMHTPQHQKHHKNERSREGAQRPLQPCELVSQMSRGIGFASLLYKGTKNHLMGTAAGPISV